MTPGFLMGCVTALFCISYILGYKDVINPTVAT